MHGEYSNPKNTACFGTRRKKDIRKLIEKGFEVQVLTDDNRSLIVVLIGPENSLYCEGKWRIQVFLPEEYPLKPPSVVFLTRIYHPNIDFG